MCWKPLTWPSWRRLFAKSFFLFWDGPIYCEINIYKLDCPLSSSLTGVENQLPERFDLQLATLAKKNNDRRMKHTQGIHCLGKYRGIFSLWPMLLLDSVPWQYWNWNMNYFLPSIFTKKAGKNTKIISCVQNLRFLGGLDETKNNRRNWLYFAYMCFNSFIYASYHVLITSISFIIFYLYCESLSTRVLL